MFKNAFFPDATRAFAKSLDTIDIKNTHTKGLLVNTYHLYKDVGIANLKKIGGAKRFMNWDGPLISDSGGFQVMSIAKKSGLKNLIDDKGVRFVMDGKKILITPESSIDVQFAIGSDLMVVLDDFTEPGASHDIAEETVTRTLAWAKRSKKQYEKNLKKFKPLKRPLLIAVVQGGEFLDLREYCAKELVKIGFDGLGYGGWPIKEDKTFNYDVAKIISENAPKNYLLYGLGVGKPEDIVGCTKLGFDLFDCVLPTRDGRHGRLYVYKAKNIKDIDVSKKNFYEYLPISKKRYLFDKKPISTACDCLTCKNYTRGYLSYLFNEKDTSAMRLASIHNLRFYSILMERIKENADKS